MDDRPVFVDVPPQCRSRLGEPYHARLLGIYADNSEDAGPVAYVQRADGQVIGVDPGWLRILGPSSVCLTGRPVRGTLIGTSSQVTGTLAHFSTQTTYYARGMVQQAETTHIALVLVSVPDEPAAPGGTLLTCYADGLCFLDGPVTDG